MLGAVWISFSIFDRWSCIWFEVYHRFYLLKRKRLYCAFVDYRKAFDLIDRKSLWFKLLHICVNGKVLNAVKNLYKNASIESLPMAQCQIFFFTCNVGVRQCENLSPLSFVVYLNDFQKHISRFYPGLKMLTDEIGNTFEEF